jgi:hypothetical protein
LVARRLALPVVCHGQIVTIENGRKLPNSKENRSFFWPETSYSTR